MTENPAGHSGGARREDNRSLPAVQLACAICGQLVDPGPGGIPIDHQWLHWQPCIAEFERARRYCDRPLLPKGRVLELFAQARAAGRLQP
jgi:hypothetical protein